MNPRLSLMSNQFSSKPISQTKSRATAIPSRMLVRMYSVMEEL